MCELLGMSACHPTDVNHSVALLRPRGGEVGPHADGWGLAFYEGKAARIFKEPNAAAQSRCLAFIADYDFQSTVVIGHIRKANPPQFGVTSANTHPFSRELGGRNWVFAHNGKLPGIHDDKRFVTERFQPIGETDSERAFCFLLEQVAQAQAGTQDQGGEHAATAAQLVAILQKPVQQLCELGEFNVLMSDGHHLIAHSNHRLQRVTRSCVEHQCTQKVTLLATAPLTDEEWQPLALNCLHIFVAGALQTHSKDGSEPPKTTPETQPSL